MSSKVIVRSPESNDKHGKPTKSRFPCFPSRKSKKKPDPWVVLIEQDPKQDPKQYLIPTGMIDHHLGLRGEVMNGLQKSFGLVISRKEMTDLTDLAAGGDGSLKSFSHSDPLNPVSNKDLLQSHNAKDPSAGACDENVRIFFHARNIHEAYFDFLENHSDNKVSTVRICKLKDLRKKACNDANALLALRLYSKFKERLPVRNHMKESPWFDSEISARAWREWPGSLTMD
ncbi:hypothetical protein EJ05DRAFT_496312 [Pseudovirgaria hyperparasitica]|uniref:Uncharacterized protein n=1 Tax=Pseudovirgaria hyperparasitica TaxID=470096 RepID=A0A6A6WMZ2_9PEZI|nr:uncharacterized protein EJ05DRAFT_496312 [Pseudovirgaria hyperparasitica]KAF2763493.1 hypothetical protein EJ05DRAFT_496312 [Pseudovirgaria hyperparasitica]